MAIAVRCVSFAEEMAAIQKIRTAVFQEEQGVDPALEWDGRDAFCDHWLADLDGEPVGTLRARSLDASTVKLERLAVLPEARRRGVARTLTNAALSWVQQRQASKVVLHAQAYLQAFYESLGFVAEGDRFLEANIPHVKMRKSLQ